MGLLSKIFRRKKIGEETLPTEANSASKEDVSFIEECSVEAQKNVEEKNIIISERYIKVIHLYGLTDVEEVQNELESGNIIIVDISTLKKNGGGTIELKRAVEQMKGVVKVKNGDIAQFSEKYIIVTPPGVKIWRKTG
ncbi:MAG: cell division protein SepF [Candidatus Odinarchaeum yellowstonii]|uniref:Cell division protein SepF n=1 Tax=Odinarchaeota yellowstonii (strain LCB_4) TaxID=1841599 RepID=A0AAF0D343_ODILC|nr:MAG: cell division protein SepF [Candidatus Odinarchaeum yellowstonii]